MSKLPTPPKSVYANSSISRSSVGAEDVVDATVHARRTPTAEKVSDSHGQVQSRGNKQENEPERVKVVARIRPPLREDETAGAIEYNCNEGGILLHRP